MSINCKSVVLMILTCFVCTTVFAQSKVSGSVTSKGGDPLPGVIVMEAGTQNAG